MLDAGLKAVLAVRAEGEVLLDAGPAVCPGLTGNRRDARKLEPKSGSVEKVDGEAMFGGRCRQNMEHRALSIATPPRTWYGRLSH